MKKLISECRKIFEDKKDQFNPLESMYNKLKKPDWMKKSNDKRFECIYNDQKLLFSEGKIVFGYIVQANTLLFEPGNFDSPACIVFSEDEYFDDNFEELFEIANSLFSLKGTNVEDSEIKKFVDVITDEMTALYNVQLPNKVTKNKAVFYTTIMVRRSHLPTKYLKLGWFPILTCPNKTKASIILPSRYWSNDLINEWL